jgi:hypothetical protein
VGDDLGGAHRRDTERDGTRRSSRVEGPPGDVTHRAESFAAAAAPAPTLIALTVVAAASLVLVLPSIGLLFVLTQRGTLDSAPEEVTAGQLRS